MGTYYAIHILASFLNRMLSLLVNKVSLAILQQVVRKHSLLFRKHVCTVYGLVIKEGCTAGPWHMRFFRLGKIRMFQIRMTEI